jgi:hypothetical protein
MVARAMKFWKSIVVGGDPLVVVSIATRKIFLGRRFFCPKRVAQTKQFCTTTVKWNSKVFLFHSVTHP